MLKSLPAWAARYALPVAAVLATLATAGPAAGPAAAQPRGQEQCFLVRNINGFSAPNDRTLYVRVGVNDIYRLDLMIDCEGLTFRQRLGLQSTVGDPWICEPIQAQIVYRDAGIANRCPVSAIHKLTPDEVAALPRRDRP
jgi:hypothetical protein